MNQLKQTAAALSTAQAKLEELQEQQDRCQEAMKAGAKFTERISELNRQRADLEGQAFLAGTVPALSEIDRQITSLTKESEAASRTAQAAVSAVGLLVPKIEDAKQAVVEATEAHQAALTETARTIFTQAEDDYHKAAQALKQALARMGAAASLHGALVGTRGLSAQVESIVAALRGDASASGLVTRGNAAGGYGLDRSLYVGRLTGETAAALSELRDALAKQGAQL